MSKSANILEVAELDFAFEPTPWAFAERKAASVAAHWARLKKDKPSLFNGRVLLLGGRAVETRADGALRLKGAFFETDFADFIAWRDFGHPGEPVDNCFSMAALCSAEGAFLLGEMAPHTSNAGQIYFPAGTPDPTDIFGRKVDLDASARRELLEETGIRSEEATIRRGWTVVFTPHHVACMKLVALDVPAAEAKARIDAFLARDPYSEFRRIHIVRGPRDIDEARTPEFVAAFLRAQFDGLQSSPAISEAKRRRAPMPLLFSYGTLQQDGVQIATFGRRLEGGADALLGYRRTMVTINDPQVIARSGETRHPIVVFTGDNEDRVQGTVFEVSEAELASADAYEVDAYKRVLAPLASGRKAWVYVDARHAPGHRRKRAT